MRLVKSLEKQDLAKKITFYLQTQKIRCLLESSYDKEKKKIMQHIWVEEEDDFEKAKKIIEDFLKDPQNSNFEVKEEKKIFDEQKEPLQQMQKPLICKLTTFFIILCVGIFFINYFQEMKILKKYNLKQLVLLTPIQKAFLYDYTNTRKELDEIIIKYDLDTEKKIKKPPIEAQEEIKNIEKQPTWVGLYNIFLEKIKGDKQEPIKMFEKIKKAEVWRLFTPALLHSGILHILFNMLWLWFLGKQMEPKLGLFRFLLFIIVVAVVSNTAQYLMAGPYFLGFSGVIMAMVGYIFVRQKIAPWEGYDIANAVFYFIGIFVLAMILLQIVAFVIQLYNPDSEFSFGIANTAHIAGALTGMLLAKISKGAR